ncbi:MAG: hypothetical protein V1863_05020 [Candidatus Omnitrophota bacterium]
MKKWFVVVGVFVLLASGAAWCQAEDVSEGKEGAKSMEKGMMRYQGKMMEHKKAMGMDPMAEKMKMKIMMPKEMVGTPDGGVIVMVGNKLLKYDKNLDLKKEVEIKVDLGSMKKMMKGKCAEGSKDKDCMKDESSEKAEEGAESQEQ